MASRHGGPCLDSRALMMLFVGFLAIFNVTTSLLTAQHIIAPTYPLPGLSSRVYGVIPCGRYHYTRKPRRMAMA